MKEARRWVPIAALAAVACVLGACGPTAPDPTTSGPVRKSAPSTTAAPVTPSSTTSTTLAKAAAPVDYRWSRLGGSALDLGGGATSTLSAVLAPRQSGGDWLLAGTRSTASGVTAATIWTSSDAIRWTATALRGGAGGQARAATPWGQRTVVVGSVGRGASQRAAVWISPNPDASFSPVPDSPTLRVPDGTPPDPTAGSAEPTGDSATFATTAAPGAAMDSVTAGALGIFASGTVAGHFALWYSSNGTTWTQLTKAESVVDSASGAVVRQVLETPAGVFAVGSILRSGTTDAALWSSGDGINWRLVSSPSSFGGSGDQTLSSISSFGPNLVVGGGIRLATSWTPASWISPNVSTWGAPSESFPEPSGKRLDLTGSVVADLSESEDGSTLAAVGGSPSGQRLWLSDDGINWAPVPFPRDVADDADWTAGAVATTDTTTVVIDPDPGQPRLLVDGTHGWREVSANPGVFGSPQAVATPTHLVDDRGRLVMTVDVERPGQALGQDQESTEILTSTNGRRWTTVATGETFAGETVSDLAVTSRGLVAVGGPSPTTAAVVSGDLPAVPTLTVWKSTDAQTWTATHLDARGQATDPALSSGKSPTPTTTARPGTTGATTTGITRTAAARTASAKTGTPTTRPAPATAAPTTSAPTTAPPTTSAPATGAPTTAAPTTSAPKTRPAPASPTTAPAPTAGAPTMTAPVAYQTPVGAVTSLGNTLYVAASFDGNPAIGWKSSDGRNWKALGTLAQEPVAEPDAVSGGCAISDAAAVVGATASGQGGSTGAAWRLSGSVTSMAVGPTPPVDSAEEILGCSDTETGSLVAWGGSASSKGAPTAALWSSSTGVGWTQRTVSAFFAASGTPAITDLAMNGNTWLAVTGSSTEPWTEDNLSALGVWESADAGKTWQQLTTAGNTWSAVFGVSADQIAYLGIDPVVAGQVDGRLAVWLGSPTP